MALTLELLQRPDDERGRGDDDDEEREECGELRVLARLGVLGQVPQFAPDSAQKVGPKVLVNGALGLNPFGATFTLLFLNECEKRKKYCPTGPFTFSERL